MHYEELGIYEGVGDKISIVYSFFRRTSPIGEERRKKYRKELRCRSWNGNFITLTICSRSNVQISRNLSFEKGGGENSEVGISRQCLK